MVEQVQPVLVLQNARKHALVEPEEEEGRKTARRDGGAQGFAVAVPVPHLSGETTKQNSI